MFAFLAMRLHVVPDEHEREERVAKVVSDADPVIRDLKAGKLRIRVERDDALRASFKRGQRRLASR